MKKYWGLFLVLFLSLFAIRPFLHSGFFPMHDDTQVARVFEMAKALSLGQFPVRWVPDLGYGFGYPVFNFYSPLPYYFGAIFVLLGLDALLATKIVFILGILLAGVFMYLLSRKFWGEGGGVMAGLFYLYAPYHAVQIFVRGSVGEFWALAFLPLMVFGIYKVLVKQKIKWVIIAGLGYASIILSHNLTALLVTLFLIPIYGVVLIMDFRKRNLLNTCYLILSASLGLGLSCFYWLPALMEMKNTNVFSQIGGGADFKDHFVFLDQLWASPWGYAGSAPGRFDGMSFMIGKIHIIMSFIVLVIGLFLWKKEKNKSKIILLFTCYLLLATFILLPISLPIWQVLPFLAFIQYPWRFLILVIFFASLLSGALLWFFKNNYLKLFIFCFLVFILLFYGFKYFQPQEYLNVTSIDYTNQEVLTWKTSKISDEYLPKNFPVPQNKEEIPQIAAILKSKPMEYNFKNNNPLRTAANLISLSSLIFILGIFFYARKNQN